MHGHRFMLDTFSLNPATEHVLQTKVADFQAVLNLPRVPLPPTWIARLFHFSRRFSYIHGLTRATLGRRNAGLFVTFNLHTLKAHAPFLLSSSGEHALVLMDCWPTIYETTIRWSRQYGIRHVFLSASQAVADLEKLAPDIHWYWLPEGLPSDAYETKPWSEKQIDVLSFGRKHDVLHDELQRGLPKIGVTYKFEPKPGEVLFPTHEEFLKGLGEAKMSICFPRSITHPEICRGLETLTLRYLQSMASKCLIYGHSPKELVDLFGYDPVVSVDWSDPVGQIQSLLHSKQEPELVTRNWETVLSLHTERHRAADLASKLKLEK